jgi:regulator of sigma E protease
MSIDTLTVILLLPLVLLIFNLIIVVHELGHFLAAHWRGLYVDRFAVWFGKPIWKKKIGGVTYILGRIPAGGYVSVPQLAPMEMVEGRLDIDPEVLRKLPTAKPIDKIIVAVAGPVFSLALAFVFACLVWVVGKPTSSSDLSRRIGYVEKDSPAKKVGLLPGDVIESVDGHKVSTFFSGDRDSVVWNIIDSEGETVKIEVDRKGERKVFEVTPEIPATKFYQRDSFKQIGVEPARPAIVRVVMEDSPALVAGVKAGDRFISVDGLELENPRQLSDHMEANKGKTLEIKALRKSDPNSKEAGQPVTFQITPEIPMSGQKEPYPMLGVEWDDPKFDGLQQPGPDPVTQIKKSALMIYNTVKALTNKHSGVKIEHMSGPVGIVDTYVNLLRIEQGWRLVLWFSVILNVNLAIMNMLPFPVLDGGHITMALLEWVTRKPINVRVLEILQTGFAVVLIGFMMFVSFFDVQNFAPQGGGKPDPLRFKPKNPEATAKP